MVAEQYPWPPVDGYRQRLGAMIAGLAAAGRVDVVTLDRRAEGHPDHVPPGTDGLGEVVVAATGPDAPASSWLGAWLRPGGPPRRVLGPDWTEARSAVAAALSERDDPVELVWCSHVDSWWPIRDLLGGVRCVVDFDNLEHLAIRLRRRTPVAVPPAAGVAERARRIVRWAVSRAFDLVDERRWDRLQRRCAAEVEAVVVCSELDRQRSACQNAVVIGNGAEPPASVVSDRSTWRGTDPVVSFVGALDYEPNADAVRWFADEVLPLVRRHHPGVRFLVVGRGEEAIGWVGAAPGVELLGRVDDLGAVLVATDVSVVPIRVGAGTRLKVVEALANHLPLVTTPVGCEGIELTDDVDALIAQDAESFAAAVVRLLDDGTTRQRLADAAAELFERRYEWSAIRAQVTEVALG